MTPTKVLSPIWNPLPADWMQITATVAAIRERQRLADDQQEPCWLAEHDLHSDPESKALRVWEGRDE